MIFRISKEICFSVFTVSLCLVSDQAFPETKDEFNPVTIQGNRITIDSKSPFTSHLSVITASESNVDAKLRSVGQIIALSDASGNPDQKGTSWIELEDSLTKAMKLNLPKAAKTGVAFGAVRIPILYDGKLKVGSPLTVRRYGLTKKGTSARVYRIQESFTDKETVDVIFEMTDALDWAPGTACQIEFPGLAAQAVRIPSEALIHEGSEEYVLAEVAPWQFAVRAVAVGEENAKEVTLLSGLKKGEKIIGHGAILLSPYLRQWLKDKKAAVRAL